MACSVQKPHLHEQCTCYSTIQMETKPMVSEGKWFQSRNQLSKVCYCKDLCSIVDFKHSANYGYIFSIRLKVEVISNMSAPSVNEPCITVDSIMYSGFWYSIVFKCRTAGLHCGLPEYPVKLIFFEKWRLWQCGEV